MNQLGKSNSFLIDVYKINNINLDGFISKKVYLFTDLDPYFIYPV